MMLKLKLQYFGHLIGQRVDSLEKTLMLGGIGGRRRRGRQRMRWLDGITDSMDVGLGELQELGEKVGGAVISVDGAHGELELLFVNPEVHSKGIGYAAWCLIEALHPEVTVWETTTPYFEKRNIHFYVNRCGFHIVEFWNSHFPGPSNPEEESDKGEMFLFRKVMNQIHTPSPLRGTPPNLGGELVTNQHK